VEACAVQGRTPREADPHPGHLGAHCAGPPSTCEMRRHRAPGHKRSCRRGSRPDRIGAGGRAPPQGSLDIQELLGIGLIVAIALLATAYVAAGIMEAGASPGPNQIEATLLYATEWLSPYLVLFPSQRSPSPAGRYTATPPSGEATQVAGRCRAERDRLDLAHLARARVLNHDGSVALVVIVGAAIGALVSSILL